ncbi:unnamed protein product [Closterium sp. Naga37s-1]|nr:unnamed protein product [Closterium sp. Naga37s-1]
MRVTVTGVFPPDTGIGTAALGTGEAVALGASEAAALGASASASSGAGESALSGTALAPASNTFTLESEGFSLFFRDRTTLTPLGRQLQSLWQTPLGSCPCSSSPLSSRVRPAPSGTLSGLYLPSSLRTWHGLPCPCLWSSPLPPSPSSGACPYLRPLCRGRQRAAPHSSQFPPTEAPLQTLHMDVWARPASSGQGHERYFLLVVDDYSRSPQSSPCAARTPSPQGPAPSGGVPGRRSRACGGRCDSGAAGGAEPGGADSGGAERVGATPGGAEPGGAEPEGATTGGAEPGGAESGGAEPGVLRLGVLSLGGATPGGAEPGGAEPEGAGPARVASGVVCPALEAAAGAGGSSAAEGAGATGPGGARTGITGAAGPAGTTGAGAAEGVGAEGTGWRYWRRSCWGSTGAAGGTGAGGAAGAGATTGGTGAVPAVSGVAAWPRPYFVPLLEQVLGPPAFYCPPPPLECPQPVPSQLQLQPASPLPAPSPYTGPTGGLAERREPASRPASPVRAARASGRGSRQRPPPVPGTHRMSLSVRPLLLCVPLCLLLLSPLFPALADPESDSLRAASPTVTRLLATVVTNLPLSPLLRLP